MMISNAEFYFWVVCGIIGAILLLACLLPWNIPDNTIKRDKKDYYIRYRG